MSDYYVALSADCFTGSELVEIGLLDELSPQVIQIMGSETDPRDAVEIAIREAESRSLPIARGVASVGYYANEGDTMTPDEARAWADEVANRAGFCAHCGDMLHADSVFDELDEESGFCDSNCWHGWVTPERRPDLYDEAELANA